MCLEEIDALLDGSSTHMARRLNSGGRTAFAAAVSTLEHHRADVLFT